MSDTQDRLLDHDYDGIRELDNDLPRWWVWLFYITIVWGVLYMFYYHVFGVGYSSADEYRAEVDPNYVRIESKEARLLGVLPVYRSPWYDPARDLERVADKPKAAAYVEETRESDTATYVALTDLAVLTAGKATYDRLCFTCHGKFGEGGIGPNLTDDYWLHGASMSDVVKTIKYGVPAKGMVPWRFELKPDQILEVASYVMTLHGTNPPNPKSPQGELVAQK